MMFGRPGLSELCGTFAGPANRGLEVDYIVQTAGDDELPEGRHVVIVERDKGPAVMLLNGLPARVWALMRQWEDTCEPCTEPSVLLAPSLRLVV